MAGRPRTSSGEICGAKNRKGNPCQCKMLFGGDKCKFHGGLSTGPKTEEGKARSYAARDAGRDRYWKERLANEREGV